MSTKIIGTEIFEKKTASTLTRLRMTIDQTVVLHLSDYPPINFPVYLADLGGAIGLWLGVGIVQLIQKLVSHFYLELRYQL